MKWGFKIALWFLALVCLAAIGIYAALESAPVQEVVLRLVTRAIEEQTQARCRIEKISGSLIANAEIKGLTLTDPATGAPLLSAKRIHIRYSAPMLLGRVLWINRMRMEGCSVHLVKGPDNQWKLPVSRAGQGDPNAAGVYRLILRRLDIVDSDVTISGDENAPETWRRAECINGRASLRIGRSTSIRIETLGFQMDPGDLRVSEFSGEIEYFSKTGRLEISHAHLKTPASDLEADIRINMDSETSGVDLSADIAALSLTEVEKLLSLPLPADLARPESISGKIQVKGPLAGLDHRIQLNLGESLIQSAGRADLDPEGGYGADLKAKIRRLDSAMLPVHSLKPYPALINADLSLNLQHVQTPGAKGEITVLVFDSTMAGHVVETLNMRAGVSGPDLTVDSCTLKTPHGSMEGSGILSGILSPDLEKRLHLAAGLQHVNAGSISEKIDFKSDLNLNLDADVRVPAGFDPAGISVQIVCKAAPSEIAGFHLDRGELKAGYDGGRLEIQRLEVSGKAGNAACSGMVAIPEGTCRLSATADSFDIGLLERFLPADTGLEGLSGKISLAVDMQGPWRHPTVSAVASGGPAACSGVSARNMDICAEWSGSLSDYHLSGRWEIEDLGVGGIIIPHLSLAAMASPESAELELILRHDPGQVLQLEGSIADIAKPVKQILISRVNFSSPHLPPLSNRGPIRMVLSPERIEIFPLVLASGDAQAEFSGTMGRQPAAGLAADLGLQGIDLARIAAMAGITTDLKGTVSGIVRLSGSAKTPGVDLRLAVLDPACGELSLPAMTLVFSYDHDQALFEMNADKGGKRLLNVSGGARGRVCLSPFIFSPDYDSVDLALDFKDMDIGQLAFVWPAAVPLQGRISASARLTGIAGTMKLAVEAAAADISYEELRISDLSASLFYQEGSARIEASGGQEGINKIVMRGTAPVRLSLVPFAAESLPEGLDVDIALNGIDVSEISRILNHPEYDAGGLVTMLVKMDGDPLRPRIDGKLRLDDGFFVLKKQGLSYETFSAEAVFDQDRLEIVQVRISGDREGELSLSGTVKAPYFHPQELDIRAVGKQFYVPFYAGIDAWGDPDLTLSGPLSAPVLSGRILVKQGRVNTEVLLGNAPSDIRVIEPEKDENGIFTVPEENPEALSSAGPLAADVVLDIPSNVWVCGKEESIEIRGSINLKKQPGASFVLYGPLHALRGTYRFRNRLFKITSGELQFIGQEEINPPVNIEAETRIEDVRIITRLTGTFDRMNMELDSVPVMSQTDIISYLIFGKPADTLSEGESFRAGEAALGLTGQFAADELRELFGEKLSFDYIGVSAGSEGFRDGSVSMGKYITPKVFVIYRYGFSEETPQQVEVNYEINRNFSLETEIDNETTSAVDLIWKYDF